MSGKTIVGFIAIIVSVQAFGATAPDVKRPLFGHTVEVLVQYKSQPTGEHHHRVLDRRGKIRQTFEHIPVVHYDVSPEALADLEADPDVVSITPNRPIEGFLDHATYSAHYWPLSNHYVSIGRGKAWGIGIAILDSGINAAHPNFDAWDSDRSRVVYSQSFVGGDTNDGYGHGTHVAGIAVGVDNVTADIRNNTTSYFGVAMDANIINFKVLDNNGKGNDATVIAAINTAITLKTRYNIRVINLSLGRTVTESYKTDPLCQAVEAAWRAGIVVVVAAGNGGRDNSHNTKGYGTITAPGNDPFVITVGATNDKADYDLNNDVIATYSSKGPTAIDHIVKPDLVAPGNRIVSDLSYGSYLPNHYPGNQITTKTYDPNGSSAYSKYFLTPSGPSMAAPIVAGVAAMLITNIRRSPQPGQGQAHENCLARLPREHVHGRH